jgi:hypothetical protein
VSVWLWAGYHQVLRLQVRHQLIQPAVHELQAVDELELADTEGHVFFHVVRDAVDCVRLLRLHPLARLVLLPGGPLCVDLSYRLHQQVPVVAAQIVEYHGDLRLVGVDAQLQVARIVGGASVFPGDVAVVADPVAV